MKCENKRNAKNSPPNFRKHFMLSKTFKVANEINRHSKNIFRKTICFGPWCINTVQSNSSGSFSKTLLGPNSSLHKFVIRHFHLKYFRNSSRYFFCFFFLKNFRKHGIALLISINQYCHTVPF